MTDAATTTLDMTLDGRASRYVAGSRAALLVPSFVPQGTPVFIIDETVAQYHDAYCHQLRDGAPALILPGGEHLKSLARLDEIYHWLASLNLTREGTIVGIGGGTILDLTGLAAATWKRGVNFVAVPTTLLAMVDAAIGGKTAVNTAGLKNPVGVFYPASGVLADPSFLATLPRPVWRDGLAEMIKTALIGAPALFADLCRHQSALARWLGGDEPDQSNPEILATLPWDRWITAAASVKTDVVNRDFREQGPRRALNLGHTLGHVIEAWSQDSDQPLSHGAAVAIGIAVVFRLAGSRGTCPSATVDDVLALLAHCGLPTSYQCPDDDALERLLGGDKKATASGQIRWVLPEDIGRMDLDGVVSAKEIRQWLR